MKVYLKIPYSRKDEAIAAGLRFDGITKQWWYESTSSVDLRFIKNIKYGNKSLEQLKEEAMNRYKEKHGNYT